MRASCATGSYLSHTYLLRTSSLPEIRQRVRVPFSVSLIGMCLCRFGLAATRWAILTAAPSAFRRPAMLHVAVEGVEAVRDGHIEAPTEREQVVVDMIWPAICE